jgi:hypothetical protein
MIHDNETPLLELFARRNYIARLRKLHCSVTERQIFILTAPMATIEERQDAERVLRKLNYSDEQISAAKKRR